MRRRMPLPEGSNARPRPTHRRSPCEVSAQDFGRAPGRQTAAVLVIREADRQPCRPAVAVVMQLRGRFGILHAVYQCNLVRLFGRELQIIPLKMSDLP
jgi:hypothetical protein